MVESRAHVDHRTKVAGRSRLTQMIISPAAHGSVESDDAGVAISGTDLLGFVDICRHLTL
jgi:hypothetical protein